jgi:dihydrolipoamide dehydrogenase
MHVYVGREDGMILGAEMLAPEGEHLAHLLAWAASAGLDVHQVLSLPFYHPVLEEGLRTALRDAAAQTTTALSPLEVLRCSDPPVGVRG